MEHHNKILRLLIVFVLACLALPQMSFSQDGDSKEKMRNRLEQLFIWRVSDRLGFTPDEESRFATEYKKLTEDRAAALHKLDDIVNRMSAAKDDKKAKAKLFSEWEEANKKSVKVQENEIPALKKILTQDQLVEYVLLKREMFHKFKDALSTSKTTSVAGQQDKQKLKEPEVIQED